MNKKNIFYWSLYDFANSVVEIVFFLYFAQWLVVENGVADIWYNLIFAIGSLMLLATAPILGSIADKTGRQQRYLNSITFLTFFCFLGASLTTLFFSGEVVLAALFFLLANYFYQFSFVFYNALLHYIAPREKWGLISGIGQAGNWLGQIVGLLVALPFAEGAVYLIGEVGRAQAFLVPTVLFFVLALPMVFFFRLPKQKEIVADVSLKDEYRSQWKKFKTLIKAPGMGLFLLAYFFFNDAIITASNNFPIFLENVFSIPDDTKSLLLVGILGTSVVGALGSGFVADKIGLKRAVLLVIGSWVVLFPLLGVITDFTLFVVAAIFMGFLFGAIWTVTRAAMIALCPKDQLNFGFSFYTLAERVSTLLGPVAWGLITTLLVPLGPVRYRIALIAMGVFVAIGFYFMRKVHVPELERIHQA
ncbi:MAG: MFS transporter [Parcubacteria group bacterium]|nr:MFS transporter [Parcubacteria group bacterium]